MPFFQQFKDNFFEDILNHYKNLNTLTINLNFLFQEEFKDRLFEKLANFSLKENVNTFIAEDSILKPKNLDSLIKSNLL